jgi:hypothetical protein
MILSAQVWGWMTSRFKRTTQATVLEALKYKGSHSRYSLMEDLKCKITIGINSNRNAIVDQKNKKFIFLFPFFSDFGQVFP